MTVQHWVLTKTLKARADAGECVGRVGCNQACVHVCKQARSLSRLPPTPVTC